jgi:hypothetical protein
MSDASLLGVSEDIAEIRRVNLRVLRDQCGSLTKFASYLGKSKSQVGQWVVGARKTGTGKRLGISDTAARWIEKKCLMPPGWLDTPHGDTSGSLTFEINHFATGGSMGTEGVTLQDQPGIIESWRVNSEWLQKNVRGHADVQNLCIVTGFGDSMRPMFNPGDPLLVDTSVTSVDCDAVYFFRVGGEGFVKRLQRIPGEGLRVISTNRENYEPWTVKPEMDFQVFGRVLKVWRSEDF